MRTRTQFLLASLIGTWSQGLSPETWAATILVPEDQPTIQACVDMASPGDICSVAPGTYLERPPNPPIGGVIPNVVVDKPITLRSRELYQAVLEGLDKTTTFIVVKANAHIEGFVIQNVVVGVISRGQPADTAITWSGSNLIVRNASFGGIGVDEIGTPADGQSSAIINNCVVDGTTNACYYTNDAGSLDVRNSIASNCPVAFQGHAHGSFTYAYSLVHGVQSVAAYVVDPADLPSEGLGVMQSDPDFYHGRTPDHDLPYLIRCTSPAIDGGDLAAADNDVLFPPSWGSTRNDIGAYGGPGASPSLSELERHFLAGQTLALEPSGPDTLLTWCTPPEVTGSDVVRGELTRLRASLGNFNVSTLECVANDRTPNSFVYSGTPGPGDGFWFLVRCEGCPIRGTYDSGAPSQIGLRDEEIATSGNDCP